MKTKNGQLPIPIMHPVCRVQVINHEFDPPRWKTIGTCYDAPNPIAAVMKRHGVTLAWVYDGYNSGRTPVGPDGRRPPLEKP